MLLLWVVKNVGVEARNTYTWGAEAGEVDEMNLVFAVARYESHG